MDKKFLKNQKKQLEQARKDIEKELKSFAKKDPNIKGNWKTRFPFFGIRTADPSEQTDQVEEYEATLPMEHALETRLEKIEKALVKIKKGKYGVCEKCRKRIRIERLKASPEADICIKCTKP